MGCLSESTIAFCFLCLKFGLDFSLDPNEQGTPGSSLRFEMPFDELDVSPVAMDAGWDPGPLPCLWVGWNPALGFGVEAATRILACRPRTVGQRQMDWTWYS